MPFRIPERQADSGGKGYPRSRQRKSKMLEMAKGKLAAQQAIGGYRHGHAGTNRQFVDTVGSARGGERRMGHGICLGPTVAVMEMEAGS